MNKFIVDKDTLIDNRNKYIIFCGISEIDHEFFKQR